MGLLPKVLVVDDTPANLLAVETILEGCGVQVVKASSGAAALKESLTGGFALVLLDVQMSGMDGYETATLMRSSARTKEIPIIFLTATHGESQAIFKGYESGAVDYIFKPLNSATLKSKVRVFADLFILREQEKARIVKQEADRFETEKRALLVAENAKLKTILDNLMIGVVLAEAPSGRIAYFNERAAEIGRGALKNPTSLEDWCAMNVRHANGKPYERDDHDLVRALKGETVPQHEVVYQFDDGSRAILLMSATPIVQEGGKTSLALLSFLDVTARVQAEEAKLVAREQLQQAYKMSALGEMAGSIAHEVNNPLAIITGKSRQLREELDSEPFNRETLTKFSVAIEEMAHRAVKIVNGLTTISRNSKRDEFVQTSVVSIIEGTLAICEARCKLESILLTVDQIPKTLTVECRATEISQIVLNLVGNALDAVEKTPDPWVKVEVKDGGDWVELAVSDSGPGVPQELREKILEPFFTTKAVGKGTGLGLSITKSIVDSHGGQFRLDEGAAHTRFVARLPKAQARGLRRTG